MFSSLKRKSGGLGLIFTYHSPMPRARAKLREARTLRRICYLVLSVSFQVAFWGCRLKTPQSAVQGIVLVEGVVWLAD